MTDTHVCWFHGSSGGVAADMLQPGHINQVNVLEILGYMRIHTHMYLYTYTEEGVQFKILDSNPKVMVRVLWLASMAKPSTGLRCCYFNWACGLLCRIY